MRISIGQGIGFGRGGADFSECVAQDFESYAADTVLTTFPGWTTRFGSLITRSNSGINVQGNSGIFNEAVYEPAGFVTAVNHRITATIQSATGIDGSNGISVAVQANGSGYYLLANTNNGALGLGRIDAAGSTLDFEFIFPGGLVSGSQIRLTVTGVGTGRRVRAEWNTGSGWVIGSGWSARDFGVYHDGGKCGIGGLAANHMRINSILICNQ